MSNQLPASVCLSVSSSLYFVFAYLTNILFYRSGQPTYTGAWVDQVTWISGMLT